MKNPYQNLDWMSAETKEKALEKLSKFNPMIGYPDEWRDYSELEVSPDDLVGNMVRARAFAHYREIDKTGQCRGPERVVHVNPRQLTPTTIRR